MIDVVGTYRYYLLQSSTASAPAKPTTYPPSSSWDDSEPTYTSGSTNSLYFVDCSVYSNDTFYYSAVSLSTAYEAAKEAYNKAVSAQNTANSAQSTANSAQSDIDNLSIGGRNLILGTSTADITGWTQNGWSGSISTYDADSRIYQIVDIDGWRSTAYPTSDYAGEQLTFSAYFKMDTENNTGTANINLWFSTVDTVAYNTDTMAGKISAEDDWQYFTCTFDSVKDYVQFMIRGADGDTNAKIYNVILMKDPKLERGNRATDWTPAQEDTNKKIELAQSTADGKNTVYYQTSGPTGTDFKVI